MWFWIWIAAGMWVASGVALLIRGCRKYGPVSDGATILACLLGGPITWWMSR